MLVLALCVLALGACGEDDDGGELTGSFSVDGSSTVFPFLESAADLFVDEHPASRVSAEFTDTSRGLDLLCAGEVEFAGASRRITAEEEKHCLAEGIEPVELEVAADGITVVSAPELDLTCLTLDQLRDIWTAGSAIDDPARLGKNPETEEKLAHAELSLFSPPPGSGTFEVFTERVNGAAGQQRSDVTALRDDTELVEGIAGERGGLGYLPHSYYQLNHLRLDQVAIFRDAECVLPNSDTVRSGDYPLARPLFVYVSGQALADPAVAGFASFLLDEAEAISERPQMIPAEAPEIERSRKRLEAGSPGGEAASG